HWSLVQTFPSSVHAVPDATKQLSAISLHEFAHSAPPAHGSPAWRLQLPPEHVSAPLQKRPSLHGALLAVCVQPFTSAPGASGSHASVVQTLPSLQSPGQNFRLSMMAVSVTVVPGACQVKYVIPVHPAAGGVTTPLAPGVSTAPRDDVKVWVPEFSTKSNFPTLNTPPLYGKR